MLIVEFDPDRDPNQGQFYVRLVDNREAMQAPIEAVRRRTQQLGYWCDDVHLETFIDAIRKAFRDRNDYREIPE